MSVGGTPMSVGNAAMSVGDAAMGGTRLAMHCAELSSDVGSADGASERGFPKPRELLPRLPLTWQRGLGKPRSFRALHVRQRI